MPNWTESEMKRRSEIEAGRTVVANQRRGVDVELIRWAKANDKFVRIDRGTAWGNPYKDSSNDENCDAYIENFENTRLMEKIPELKGMALGCWCHPKRCHGHFLADLINRINKGAVTGIS